MHTRHPLLFFLSPYFQTEEIIHIIICVVAISFAFSLSFSGFSALLYSPKEFLVLTVLSFVTVGSGFILHEMAHKLVAISYGVPARFVMWIQGLGLMLVTSIFGFMFAAPGAVYIFSDRITTRQNGIISFVGPLVNLLLVLFFFTIAIIAPIKFHLSFLSGTSMPGFGIERGALNVWYFGASLNMMLALFNMIPAYPLDGSKVLRWSKAAWGGGIAVFLSIATFLIGPFAVFSWLILLVLALVLSKFAFG